MILAALLAGAVCVGDSLTFASGGYADQLGCENHGRPGWSAADWSTGELPDVQGRTVSILLGTGDVQDQRTPAQLRADLTTVVDRLIGSGAARVYLSTPPRVADPIGDHPWWPYTTEVTNCILGAYRQVILDLCDPCGPDFYALEIELSDGVHPTAAGHATMRDAWLALPEPRSGVLLGLGLIVLGGLRR